MATRVNVHEAKTHLSRLLEQVERGEEIVIARNGKPVARVIPFEATGAVRVGEGAWAGKAWIAEDFAAYGDEGDLLGRRA